MERNNRLTFRANSFIHMRGAQQSFGLFGLILSLSAVAGSLCVANADTPRATPVSSPQITIMLEPYTANGQMRMYTVPGGLSYWTGDLPIYQGDKVKIDIFVATGADDLQRLKVRLDNGQVADMTSAPWSSTIATDSLGAGYHYLEAWAQVSGPKPQYVTRSMTFFISPQTSAGQGIQPVSQVKGQQQILTGGQVVNVPLPTGGEGTALSIASPAAAPRPAVLANAAADPRATVTVSLRDVATQAAIPAAGTVAAPALLSVAPAAGSSAQKFAYMLLSGDRAVVDGDRLLAIDATRIRLQPRTSSLPGLLPGQTTVMVWGVDKQGNYGPPATITLQIAAPAGG